MRHYCSLINNYMLHVHACMFWSVGEYVYMYMDIWTWTLRMYGWMKTKLQVQISLTPNIC